MFCCRVGCSSTELWPMPSSLSGSKKASEVSIATYYLLSGESPIESVPPACCVGRPLLLLAGWLVPR